MTEIIGGGTGSSVRQGNLTVREKVEGDHKLVPRRSLFQVHILGFFHGRCVGSGFGVLWCVSVIYGEAGKVRYVKVVLGASRFVQVR